MLVLTRKLQQQIKIGEQITVTILKLKGNTVRVGIDAPRDVRVVRGELPKDGTAEVVASERPQILVDSAAATVGAPAADSSSSDSESNEAASPVTAAHLPLRRIRNRYGTGPLKQVIASCPTLAK